MNYIVGSSFFRDSERHDTDRYFYHHVYIPQIMFNNLFVPEDYGFVPNGPYYSAYQIKDRIVLTDTLTHESRLNCWELYRDKYLRTKDIADLGTYELVEESICAAIDGSALLVSSGSPATVATFYPDTQLHVDRFTHPYETQDIAHTTNKLWLRNGISSTSVTEYDITLDPWSQIVNRVITGIPASAGLCAIDDTTLITVNGTDVYVCDITTTTAFNTYKFSLLSGRNVTGDFMLTTTGKFIVTNNTITGTTTYYISQYDWATGTLEFDLELLVSEAKGLFEHIGEIYFNLSSGGDYYHIENDSPYTTTLYNQSFLSVNGASQVPEAVDTHFTPNI